LNQYFEVLIVHPRVRSISSAGRAAGQLIIPSYP
jgi:hypothetical protein